MSEQTYNLLAILRAAMSLAFTSINIFVLNERKFSKKVTCASVIGTFTACMLVNVAIVVVYDFYTLTRVFLLTTTLPYVILLIALTKDNIFKSQFNFWAQINVFCMVYVISSYLTYRFHIGIILDMIIRLFFYVGVLFLYVKYVRKPYRTFVNIIDKGWAIISVISILFAAAFISMLNFPTPIEQRPENYATAAIVVVLMIATYGVIYLTFKKTYDLMLRSQVEQSMRLQVALQKEQYSAVQERIQIDEAFRHDIRHHANLLIGMLSKNNLAQALAYTQKLGDYTLDAGTKNYAENLAANAILSAHLETAEKKGIQVTCKAVVPPTLPIDEMEFCVILSNLLENAVEHCAGSVARGPLRLDISIVQNKEQLCIKIQNSFSGALRQDEYGEYLSAKPRGGIGLKSVRALVEKNKGVMDIQAGQDTFTVFTALKLSP